jgi:putative NAD(P)H nitroreductase
MDLIQSIKERRSINFFEPGREIPEERIRELLALANLSPSSFNLQPWRVIVVKDPERKKALRACAMNQPKVEEASFVLIMMADPEGVELNTEPMLQRSLELGYIGSEDQKPGMRGLIGKLYGEKDSLTRKVFAVKNTALFAMNLMNAARGLGLETHPMDGFDQECVKKEFSIPEDKIIPMLIAVGYLKEGVKLLPRAFRREIDEFTGFDTYK